MKLMLMSTANIGSSMLQYQDKPAAKRQDLTTLGRLLFRLMELGTSLKDPETLVLVDPDAWDKEIKDFLQATSTGPSLLVLTQVGSKDCVTVMFTLNPIASFSSKISRDFLLETFDLHSRAHVDSKMGTVVQRA